jgi:hypothetical protein
MPRDRLFSLRLGEQVLELLIASGATQAEQFAALGVAREMIPVSGSSLIEPEDGSPAGPEGEPSPS